MWVATALEARWYVALQFGENKCDVTRHQRLSVYRLGLRDPAPAASCMLWRMQATGNAHLPVGTLCSAMCVACMATSRGGQRFVRVGLPLIMLTVGGWLGIAHVLSGKFELRVRTGLPSHMPSYAPLCTTLLTLLQARILEHAKNSTSMHVLAGCAGEVRRAETKGSVRGVAGGRVATYSAAAGGCRLLQQASAVRARMRGQAYDSGGS
jgi:hypothetical protein